MSQYTLREIGSWLGQKDLPDVAIHEFLCDSRKIGEKDFFIALRGARFDGHTFLQEVAAKGAKAALVSRDYTGGDFGLVLIRADDVIASLQLMAKKCREGLKARVVAVTGSVGKTTTKDFIATLLSTRYKVAKSQGNANSQIGLPISILNYPKDCEFVVQEMAMTEPGNITKLVKILPPEIVVITKVGYSHVASFKNGLEGVSEAKAEILSHPDTKWCIAYKELTRFPAIATGGFCNKFFMEFEEVKIDLPFKAKHLIENFALACQVVSFLGVSTLEIASKAKELVTYKNRFELVEKEEVIFLNDSYNASPESTSAALDNLPAHQGKTIFAFGGCPELGPYHEIKHQEIANLALKRVDHLLVLGKELLQMVQIFKNNQKPAELFEDFEEFKKRIYALAKKGDLVLIKSMNPKQLWRVLD